jgi:hypothetical protein
MRNKTILCLFLAGLLQAQAPNPMHDTRAPDRTNEVAPIYRVNVIDSSTTAINYGKGQGATKIDFRGTVLLPEARGEAKIESKQGATQIEAKFKKLEPPTRFGREYLTYVLWAITPDGRATNLGQIVTDDKDEGQLRTSSEFQAFALIVTAEPYYVVTQPSDVVVMENAVRSDTKGKVETVKAKYELLKRGNYTYDTAYAQQAAGSSGKKVSLDEYEAILELYQAQNAVQIARAAGADEYAPETFRKAQSLLHQAEHYHAANSTKRVVATAREATQTAEDARIVALNRKKAPETAEYQAAPEGYSANTR